VLVAERVVDVLEPVEVHETDRAHGDLAPLQPLERGEDLALELHPVRQSGEAVVQGVVAELVDEPAVLERDARVVGDRLQQAYVGGVEAADVTEPVGDHQRADDPGVTTQRGEGGVAVAELLQVALLRRVLDVARQQDRLLVVDDPLQISRRRTGPPPRAAAAGRSAGARRAPPCDRPTWP
jgi:hypothetical protein